MYTYYLALRYLCSRPINLLGVLGMALGVWALVLVPGIFDGYQQEISSHIKRTSADLQLNNLGRQADYTEIQALLGDDANIAAMAPRVVWMALLDNLDGKPAPSWRPGTMDTGGRFVTVNGIDPLKEAQATGFADWLAQAPSELRCDPARDLQKRGDWLLLSTHRCVSQELRRGSELLMVSARTERQRLEHRLKLGEKRLRLAGAYRTQHHGFDAMMAFVHIDELREIIGHPDSQYVNEVAIHLRDRSEAARRATTQRILARLSTQPSFRGLRLQVRSPEEYNRVFIEAVDHQANFLRWVLFAIMVISGFLVYATMSMMVTEKTHDIGVLAALGATPGGIQMVFVGTGLAVSLAGTLLGIGAGWTTAVYLDDFNTWMREAWDVVIFRPEVYNLPRVPYYLDPWWLLWVSLGAAVIGLFSAFLPGFRASRQDPLDSLRNA